MSKGFLTIAQNGQYDYVKMAYVLAMSLQLSQKKHKKLSVMVNENEKIPSKYIKYFDKIIPIKNSDEQWKIQNKWSYYVNTPYDETIVLDCDMLFFRDISIWWECLNLNDIEFTNHTKNYRGETTSSDYYRTVFTNNKLPNLHTALFYFKKSKENEQFFKFVKIIFENWKEFFNKFLKTPPKFASGDVIYALATKIFFNRKWDSFLTFTHMRSRLQHEEIVDDWTKELHIFFTKYHGDLELKVNNFNQTFPFHYIKKNFITDEVLEVYEDAIRLL